MISFTRRRVAGIFMRSGLGESPNLQIISLAVGQVTTSAWHNICFPFASGVRKAQTISF